MMKFLINMLWPKIVIDILCETIPNEPQRGWGRLSEISSTFSGADIIRSSNFSTDPNKRVGKISFLVL